jgi:hypothetical protein
VTSDSAHLACIADGIGERWEVLNNAYKPYPCGCVVPDPGGPREVIFSVDHIGRPPCEIDEIVATPLAISKKWNLAHHGSACRTRNFNLTSRALQMTDDAPTGAVRAVASDCWPNLGLRGPGVFVAMRDRQAGLLPRPQDSILPCSELPR